MEIRAIYSRRKYILVLLFQFSFINNVASHTVEFHNSKKQDHGSRVVHDVTKIMPNNTLILQDVNHSMAYFQPFDSDICWGSYTNGTIVPFKCGDNFYNTTVSFLFPVHIVKSTPILESSSNTDILDLFMKYESVIDAVIYSVTINIPLFSCNCEQIDFFVFENSKNCFAAFGMEKRSTRSSIKRGLEYDLNLIKCCSVNRMNILPEFDLTILRVLFSPLDEILSYGLFSEKLNKIVSDNQEFVRKYNSNCTIYIRILLQQDDNQCIETKYRYHALVAKYINAWTEENKGDEKFILEAYPLDTKLLDNLKFLRNFVSPTINSDLSPWYLAICDEDSIPCRYKSALSLISSVFKSTEVSRNILFSLCSSEEKCLIDVDSVSPLSTMAVFDILPALNDDQEMIKILAENRHLFQLQKVYFLDGFEASNYSVWENTASFLEKRNIQVGCYVRISKYISFTETEVVEAIKNDCRSLLNVSKEVVCKFKVTPEKVPMLLSFLGNFQQIFDKHFPGIIFIPAVSISVKYVPGTEVGPAIFKDLFRNIREILYCNAEETRINEYYNGILTFGKIHNWTRLHLRHALGDASSTGWWQSIETKEELGRNAEFPVIIRTNAAKLIPSEDQLPFTYACLVWTEKPIDTGIPFLNNVYAGTTFDMSIKTPVAVTPLELETMLLFAYGKFTRVELQVASKSDWDLIPDVVLNKMFLQAVRRDNNTSIFVEMPINMVTPSKNLRDFSSDIAFHFTGWEDNESHEMKTMAYYNKAQYKKYNIKIGLSVAKCADEVNNKLVGLSNSSIISQLDYLVCDTRPVITNNVDKHWMDDYLNSMFYMKTYIETFAIKYWNVRKDFSVYFRLNLIAESYCDRNVRKSTDAFLRFLNDVNQHSLAYQVNYFIVKAFENEITNGQCSKSWWRLESFENLSNLSVYVDREEEYFRRPTKLTLQLSPEPIKQDDSQDNTVLIVIFSVVSFILVVAVVGFWLSWQRSRKRYLAEKEVNDFYNGVTETDSATNTSKWLGIGFPKSYEIAKLKIEIGRLIGSGEFGKVFIGKLDEDLDVAIKIPQPNGSKELFKSALNEVKILCFVGNGEHLNVVLFLGAYTREIVKGKIYIVTEYCTNGSLQAYLQQRQTKNYACVDIYELYKFAHEIASGMEYISGKRVVHGDLSTRNIFLDDGLNCKIGDFGLSRKLYEYNEYVKKSQDPLPWRWMAIETLKNMEFTTKSDVWSYGVTVWEIFSLGTLPYPGLAWSPDFTIELENGMRMSKASLASTDLHEKLLLCWSCVADERPTFSELEAYFSLQRKTEYTNVIG